MMSSTEQPAAGDSASKGDLPRNLGEQPLADLLSRHDLSRHDLVAASSEQITHKMVARACKGRRLTANVQGKILRALCAASGKDFTLGDLFDYS